MNKKIGFGGLINPANLWGKPLPTAAPTPKTTKKEKVAGTMTDDDDIMEDADIDVDAELADADVDDEELHAVEAETNEGAADEPGDSEADETESADEEPDYDAEEGDSDAEDSVSKETVVAAVVDDNEEVEEEVETKSVSAPRGKRSMTSTKVSLSEHVRNEISKRKDSGASLRGKDIVDALAKRKIEVSPAQVSQLLKKAGLGGQPRGSKPAAVTPAEATPTRVAARTKGRRATDVEPVSRAAARGKPAANGGFKVPMTQLQAAEAFVDACGGSFKNAERILTAAAQLSQTFGD